MSESSSARIDRLCDDFEENLGAGLRPPLLPILQQVEPADREKLLRELLALESELLHADEFAQRLTTHRTALPQFASFFDELTRELLTAAPESASPLSDAGPPEQIGPYRVLELIGEGGMGSVYLAQQVQPVRRRVALKVIKAGLDSRQVLARFDAERQALAMMDHPSIARILDAGTTATGQPYFAMEWVNGIPLTDYCDQHKLSVPERLGLFRQICDAVQHAHQKGIIHRDLKPANILVTEYEKRAVPKVIDFGLAKALDTTHRLTEQTLFTEFGQVLGTLKYMSPEQAGLDALDIDTRSDIYTLGVILYELLTGSTPLDETSLQKQTILQILELVREQEPLRPSSRLTTEKKALATVTQRRQVDPRKLTQMLTGDLDWIVMKALEKDRNRRFGSAVALGDDIGNFLNDEPVTARPPSKVYRLQKFIKKNRGLVTTAAAIVILLASGVASTSYLYAKAESARRLAEAERSRAANRESLAIDAVKRFGDTITNNPQLKNDHKLMPLRVKLLQEPIEFFQSLRASLLAEPTTDAGSLLRLADATFELGSLSQAIGRIDQAIDTYQESAQLYEELISATGDSTHEANLAIVANNTGNLLFASGDLKSALESHKRAYDLRRKIYPSHPESPELKEDFVNSCINLATVYLELNEPNKANTVLEQGEKLIGEILDQHPDKNRFQATRARLFRKLGRYYVFTNELEEALAIIRASVVILEQQAEAEPENANTLLSLSQSHNALADILSQMEIPEASREHMEAAIRVAKQLVEGDPSAIGYLKQLADSYYNSATDAQSAGNKEYAAERYQLAVEVYSGLLESDPLNMQAQSNLGRCFNNLAILALEDGDVDSAVEYFSSVIQIRRQQVAGSPENAQHQSGLGGVLSNVAAIKVAQEKYSEALEHIQEAIRLQEAAVATQPSNPTYREFLTRHLNILSDIAAATDDEALRRQVREGRDSLAASDPDAADVNATAEDE